MREPARQLFVTAVEPRRHRSHRTTQRLCNLLVWQVLEIFQHDRHPQLRLQLRQRRQHGFRNFEPRQPLFLKRFLPPILHFDPATVFIALGSGGGAQEIERDQSSPFPKFIHAFISHHAIKPRFEIRFVTEAGDAREEFQKDLLRHVARRVLVAGEAQGDRPHAILVGLEQLTKSFAVPALTGFDQTPLARLFIHYGAPFHKMPEVAPSDSCGRSLWRIPRSNSVHAHWTDQARDFFHILDEQSGKYSTCADGLRVSAAGGAGRGSISMSFSKDTLATARGADSPT